MIDAFAVNDVTVQGDLAAGLRLLYRKQGGHLSEPTMRALNELDRACLRKRAVSAEPVFGSVESTAGAGDVLLTSVQVKDILGCSDRNVRGLARRGTLPAVKVGRSYRFRLADVELYRRRVAS